MRPRWLIVLPLALALQAGPSAATSVVGIAALPRCISVSGTVPGGYASASACIIPGAVAGTTVPGTPVAEPTSSSYGIIFIQTTAGFDWGFTRDLPANAVQMDPALLGGTLNLSVSSDRGGVLFANVSLTGEGPYRLDYNLEGYATTGPVLSGSSSGFAFLSRSGLANPGGFIVSGAVGGGSFAGGGGMSEGVSGGVGGGTVLPS